MTGLDPIHIDSVVRRALAEDVGSGDITTALTVPPDREASGRLIARQEGVVAGHQVARAVFEALGGADYRPEIDDGQRTMPGQQVAVVTGGARTILTGERVALNFLQRMSGVASLTARCVGLVSHTKARIIDTRKTTPGLRQLEKYAVRIGGGYNHRFGLSDGILIKDNHIAAAGGITAALLAARQGAPHTLRIEIEVTTLNQLDEAITSGADAVLLDNMSLDTMKQAVELASGRVLLEASGGVSEENVAAIAETGVDLISIGALTHSAPALDIGLDL